MRYIIKSLTKKANLYWSGCGWTDNRKTAQALPSKADQEKKVRQMELDRIMATVEPF
jgi:hypothetical protein